MTTDNGLQTSTAPTFAEAAFDACALKAKSLGRRLKRDEWLDAVQEVYNSFAIKKSQVKRKPTQIDDAWLAELEADPTFAGIDIRRELGKAQAWASVRNVGVSRMRFVNWLNKAVNDRPIAFNGAGATSFAKPAPKVWEPLGWREWVRENAQDPTWADRPWTSLDSAAQKYIIGELDRGESTVQVPQQDDPPDSRGDETPLLGRREMPRDSQTLQSLLSVHLAGL